MIQPDTSSYYVIKTDGEAAGAVVAEISPKVGHDILTAILVSADYQSDIQTVNGMDTSLRHIATLTPGSELRTEEKYNPIYMPGTMEMVDEVLSIEPRENGIRFVGFSGNPFILKTVEVHNGDEQLVVAKVEFRPYDIPGYTELIEARAAMKAH